MTTGERIKHLRQLKGMTLEQLGNEIGVGKSTIRKWEEGEIKSIKAPVLAKISIALKCSLQYLTGDSNDPTMTFDVALTQDEQNLILEYRKADATTKEMVNRVLVYSGQPGQHRQVQAMKKEGNVG